ncbi:hypothetical protein FHX48_002665 [Microbacterium halimionae]|uniref:Peptidase inhibitor family I36 n=1 Tax=Microbacterium halimionae TaxID=1526413 RepID=A0A7W3PMF3_9MICO|nr:hypothetical protein [Microbacterium halimionae]MBA8817560.1 hypothetical protein [Microbacterium halimionae]NII94270.1 hypothetical protein [Microbacterium halimionae]
MTRWRGLASVAVGAVLVVAGLFAVPTAASASEVQVSTAPARACTVGGLPITSKDDVTRVPTVISCFDTVAAAKEFIADGAPGDLEKLLGVAGETPSRTALAAESTVHVGTLWSSTGASGTSLLHWGTGSGCNGVTYGFPSLPSGWNDTARSARGYANCWVTTYANTSYGGSRLNCTPYCSTLGSLNGAVSSVVYRPSGTFG